MTTAKLMNPMTATFAVRIARWRPALIDQTLLLHRVQQISDFIKLPPYPDIHRTVSIFVRYAGALTANRGSCHTAGGPHSSHQQPDSRAHSHSGAHAQAHAHVHGQTHGGTNARYEPSMLQHYPSTGAHANLSGRASEDTAIPAAGTGPGTGTGGGNGQASANGNPNVSAGAGAGAGSGTGAPIVSMEVPNWTLSTPIADSFGLFEEGQADVFDFLPAMAGM